MQIKKLFFLLSTFGGRLFNSGDQLIVGSIYLFKKNLLNKQIKQQFWQSRWKNKRSSIKELYRSKNPQRHHIEISSNY